MQSQDPVNAPRPGDVLSTVMERSCALPVGQRFTMVVMPAPEGEQPATSHIANDYGPWIVTRHEDVEDRPNYVKVHLLVDPLPPT